MLSRSYLLLTLVLLSLPALSAERAADAKKKLNVGDYVMVSGEAMVQLGKIESISAAGEAEIHVAQYEPLEERGRGHGKKHMNVRRSIPTSRLSRLVGEFNGYKRGTAVHNQRLNIVQEIAAISEDGSVILLTPRKNNRPGMAPSTFSNIRSERLARSVDGFAHGIRKGTRVTIDTTLGNPQYDGQLREAEVTEVFESGAVEARDTDSDGTPLMGSAHLSLWPTLVVVPTEHVKTKLQLSRGGALAQVKAFLAVKAEKLAHIKRSHLSYGREIMLPFPELPTRGLIEVQRESIQFNHRSEKPFPAVDGERMSDKINSQDQWKIDDSRAGSAAEKAPDDRPSFD